VQGRTEVGTVVVFISGLSRVNDRWGDLVNYFRDATNARVKYRMIADAIGQRAAGVQTPVTAPRDEAQQRGGLFSRL
jgi:hypothetical protein